MDKDALQRIAVKQRLGTLTDAGEFLYKLIERPNAVFTFDLIVHNEPLVITAVSHHKVPSEKRESVCFRLNGLHRQKIVKWILCCDGILNVQIVVLGTIDEAEAERLLKMVINEMDTYLPFLIA